MKQLVIPAAIALLLAACSSTPDADKAGGGAPVESRGPGVATVTTGGVDSQRLPPRAHRPKQYSFQAQRLFRLRQLRSES